jgi:DNA-binding NarL/FixJ family response regulator
MDTPALALIAARPISLRYSLLALLARLPQIDFVQSVEDIRSMLATLTATQPKLVVLDVNLPGEETGNVLEQIKTIAPHTRTVVLVDHVEQQQELQATPADLVLLKGYPAAELFASVEQLLIQDDQGEDT